MGRRRRRNKAAAKAKEPVAAAAPPPAAPCSALDLLPLSTWEDVAQRLGSVQDLWVITATCSDLRARRAAPAVRAWRTSRVSLAKHVHECNIWLRTCRHNTCYAMEDASVAAAEEGFDIQGRLDGTHVPLQAFLDACPAYATANMHKVIASRREFKELLGSDDWCADMVTAADKRARTSLVALGEWWYDFLDGTGLLEADRAESSWVIWAVEELVGVLRVLHGAYGSGAGGLGASSLLYAMVPAELKPYSSHEFELHVARRKNSLAIMQPLRDWLQDNVVELGAPFVAAVKRRFG